jgi:hypothetical protein
LGPGVLPLKFSLEAMFFCLLDLLSISFLFLIRSALKRNRPDNKLGF